MLFIVYGATLEWGWRSRVYFRENVFSVIRKYNYVDDDSPMGKSAYENANGDYLRWFDDKTYVTEEEYADCDFQYELNGVTSVLISSRSSTRFGEFRTAF